MQRRLAFVDPFLRKLYSFEPRVICGFEGPTEATESLDSPESVTLPTDYNAKFPAPAATRRQIYYMNVMAFMFEFHCQPHYWIILHYILRTSWPVKRLGNTTTT